METITPTRSAARRGQPFFADAPVSRLIAASGLSDAAFAQLSGATVRTVRAWRRGDKSTGAGRYVALQQMVQKYTENSLPESYTKG